MRRIWQASMIGLARSSAMKSFMQNSRATSFLRNKYVAGETVTAGAERAVALLEKNGIRSSLFFMGEYVDDPALIAETVQQKHDAAEAIAQRQLDIHISVDPTQIGYVISPQQTQGHALKLAKEIKRLAEESQGIHCLMFDMEDASLNDPTIALHNTLQDQGLPVALTLQAYMRRTMEDMEKQVQRGSRVRLVKGAFAAGPKLAFQGTNEIKHNSRQLIELMFSKTAKSKGFYPIIATHDTNLHDFAILVARKNGWSKGEYEFEMLLGVREDIARNLALQGERVRLYVPFGRDWWPHAVRRIGENPRNAVLLTRSLFS
ncbi:MAG: proline dehydrogenase family protein [Pelagimonas sp.]|uniref:proline dehydrogenase family protein n=1 Tax=Pelagimonas sp. TaxID=2073170 RepID=UPI003D6AC134